MKKTALLLFVTGFLVAGCSFYQKQEVPVAATEEIKLEKKIGIVGSAQDMMSTNVLSPYILVGESNETFYIDSVIVNLKKYGKRRVEIDGKWNDSKTVFNVDAVTSLGQETQSKSEYQNPGLGIKFEYPSIWALNEEKNVVGLEKIVITPYEVDQSEINSVDTITIERSENNKKLTPIKWLSLDDQFKSTDIADTAFYQGAKIGIAQSDAVKKISGPGEEEVEFFVARDVYMYHFSHSSMNDSDKDMYKNAFFNLVQSFEFIPFGKNTATLTPIVEPKTITDPTAGSSAKEEEVKKPEKEVVEPAPVVSATPQTPANEVETPDLAKTNESAEPVVLQGFTLLTAKGLKVSIQYPSKWYWSQNTGGYGFSTKPVDESNVVVQLSKGFSIPDNMASIGELNGKPASQGLSFDLNYICVQGKEKFCASGSDDYVDTMKKMLESLIEL